MKKESNTYWEHCWKNENPEELYRYLQGFYKANNKMIDIFKEHELKKICDAGCGFGAYTLAFASHGFLVHSFDISQNEWNEIDELCKECNVIFRECNSRGEKLVILKNAD